MVVLAKADNSDHMLKVCGKCLRFYQKLLALLLTEGKKAFQTLCILYIAFSGKRSLKHIFTAYPI